MSERNTILPILSEDIIEEIEGCHIAFWAEKLAALRSLPGNPYDAEVRQFGQATALQAVGTNNSPLFNRVGNFHVADLPLLESIITWYRSQNVRCRFDIIPSHGDDRVFRRLAAQGFYQSGFYGALYGLPQTNIAVPPRIHVRTVRPEEIDLFADLYLAAFDIPRVSELTYLRESVRLLFDRPSAYCFLATVDNVPAGMAILYIQKQIGYLATAGVLPAFRGYGCHKALLHARMTVARVEECQIVVGCAGIGTASQHNMEKMGMRVAYTKAIWTEY